MLYFKHACQQLKQRPLFALALFGIALVPAALITLGKSLIATHVAAAAILALVGVLLNVPAQIISILLAAGSARDRIKHAVVAALATCVPVLAASAFTDFAQALSGSAANVPAIASGLLALATLLGLALYYLQFLFFPLYYALCAQNEPRPFRRACSLSAHPLLLIRAFFTTLWPLLLAALVFNQVFLLIPATKALSGYLTTALTMPLSAFMMLDYANAASKLQPPPQPIQESNED